MAWFADPQAGWFGRGGIYPRHRVIDPHDKLYLKRWCRYPWSASIGKGRRLKQAKEEAQSEIESYRNQREGQYKKYEQSVLGSRGDREKLIEKDTERKIVEIQENVRKTRQQALSRVLDMVYDIKPEMHTNLRL